MSESKQSWLKSECLPLLMLIGGFALSIYFYQHFPEEVPTHWNINGQVDGYSSRGLAAFMMPSLAAFIYLLLVFLPEIDPKKEAYREFASSYRRIKELIIAFLLLMSILTGLNGLGHPVDISFWVPIIVGVLFIFLGFLMAKTKSNFFVGVRTPWTLSSEKVWQQTHEAGLWVFSSAGLLMAASAFVPNASFKVALFAAAVVILIFVLPVYSYLLLKKERKENHKS